MRGPDASVSKSDSNVEVKGRGEVETITRSRTVVSSTPSGSCRIPALARLLDLTPVTTRQREARSVAMGSTAWLEVSAAMAFNAPRPIFAGAIMAYVCGRSADEGRCSEDSSTSILSLLTLAKAPYLACKLSSCEARP